MITANDLIQYASEHGLKINLLKSATPDTFASIFSDIVSEPVSEIREIDPTDACPSKLSQSEWVQLLQKCINRYAHIHALIDSRLKKRMEQIEHGNATPGVQELETDVNALERVLITSATLLDQLETDLSDLESLDDLILSLSDDLY